MSLTPESSYPAVIFHHKAKKFCCRRVLGNFHSFLLLGLLSEQNHYFEFTMSPLNTKRHVICSFPLQAGLLNSLRKKGPLQENA